MNRVQEHVGLERFFIVLGKAWVKANQDIKCQKKLAGQKKHFQSTLAHKKYPDLTKIKNNIDWP
ncbi:MAG: hypothetical protein AABY86_18235 [Bdellovibrionota bacterium]